MAAAGSAHATDAAQTAADSAADAAADAAWDEWESHPVEEGDIHAHFGHDSFIINGDALVLYLARDTTTGGSLGSPQTLPFAHAAEALVAQLVAGTGSARVVFFEDVGRSMHPVLRLMRTVVRRRLEACDALRVSVIRGPGGVWSHQYAAIVAAEVPSFVMTLSVDDALVASDAGVLSLAGALSMSALAMRTVTDDQAGVVLFRGEARTKGGARRLSLAQGRLRCQFAAPATSAKRRAVGSLGSATMARMRAVVEKAAGSGGADAASDGPSSARPEEALGAAPTLLREALAAIGESAATAQSECGAVIADAKAAAAGAAARLAAEATGAAAAEAESATKTSESSALLWAALAETDAIIRQAGGAEARGDVAEARRAAEEAVAAAARAAAAAQAGALAADGPCDETAMARVAATAKAEEEHAAASRLASSGMPFAVSAGDFDPGADAVYFAAVAASVRLVLDDPGAMSDDPHLQTLCRVALLAAAVVRSTPLQDRTFDQATLEAVAAAVPAARSVPAFAAELAGRLDEVLRGSAGGPELADVLDARLLTAVLVLLSGTGTAARAGRGAEDDPRLACAAGVSALLRGSDADLPSSAEAVRRAAREVVRGRRASVESLVEVVAQARAFAACGSAWAWLGEGAKLALPLAPWEGLAAAHGAGPDPAEQLADAAEASLASVPTLPRPAGTLPQAILLERFGAAGGLVVDKTARSSDPWPIEGLATSRMAELLVATLDEDDPYSTDHFTANGALMEGFPLQDSAAPAEAEHAAAGAAGIAATREGVYINGVLFPRVRVPTRTAFRDMNGLQRFWYRYDIKQRQAVADAVNGRGRAGMTAAQVAALLVETRRDRRRPERHTAEETQKLAKQEADRARQLMHRSIERSARSQGYQGIPTVKVTEGEARVLSSSLIRRDDRGRPMLTATAKVKVENAVSTLTRAVDAAETRLGKDDGSLPPGLKELLRRGEQSLAKAWLESARPRRFPGLERTAEAALEDDVRKLLEPAQVEAIEALFHRQRQVDLRLDTLWVRFAHQAMLARAEAAGQRAAARASAGRPAADEAAVAAGAGALEGDLAAWMDGTLGRASATELPGGDASGDAAGTGESPAAVSAAAHHMDEPATREVLSGAFQAATGLLHKYKATELAESPLGVTAAVRCLADLGFQHTASELVAPVLAAAQSAGDAIREDLEEDLQEAVKVTHKVAASMIHLTGRDPREPEASARTTEDGGTGPRGQVRPEVFQLTTGAAVLARAEGVVDRRLPFRPDPWQVDLLDAVDARRSCVVSAPTSSGKTFICYYALEQVLRAGDGLMMYVSPTDELTYQSRTDTRARYEKEYTSGTGWQVGGLLTRRARERVEKCQLLATTADCARAALESATGGTLRRRLRWIILDEVHTLLDDPDMEKALLAADCPILALSATIGEADRFASWLGSLERRRGRPLQLTTVHERWNDLQTHVFDPAPTVGTGPAAGAEPEDGAAARAAGVEPGAPGADEAAAAASASSSDAAAAAPAAHHDEADAAADAGDSDFEADIDSGDEADPTTGNESLLRAEADGPGSLHALHPVATVSADQMAESGVPAGISLLPEDAVTLHGAMTAAIRCRLGRAVAAKADTAVAGVISAGLDGVAAPSEGASAALEAVLAELEAQLDPGRYRWRQPLRITLREARGLGRKLVRRLARVAAADKPTAKAVIAALAPRSHAPAPREGAAGCGEEVFRRSDGVLAASGNDETVAANLLSVTTTMRARGMLPALFFRLSQDSCAPMLWRLCSTLDRLEHAYRSSEAFEALVESTNARRRELEAKLARLQAARAAPPSRDDKAKANQAAEFAALDDEIRAVEQELAGLPSPFGVLAQFTLAGSGGRGAPTLSDLRDLPVFKRLSEHDVTYDPSEPKKHFRARALLRGIGMHTGLVGRSYRRAVEVLFRERKLSVVVCAATLALGINMPCRSVVFLGDSPGLNTMTYRQMAGRAGRRGYDNRGNVVFVGVPSAKVRRLVTSSAPRLSGTSTLGTAAAARFSARHAMSGLDIQRLGQTAAADGARQRRGGDMAEIRPGGQMVKRLGPEATRAEVQATVAAAARAAESGLLLQDPSEGAGGSMRPGQVVRPARREAFVRHDDPDSDDEGGEGLVAHGTVVLGGPEAAGGGSDAAAAASASAASPLPAPADSAGAALADVAGPARQSGRLALAVMFEQLRRVGAVTDDGKPTGLGGLVASFGRLGPGGPVLAGVIASGALTRAWVRPLPPGAPGAAGAPTLAGAEAVMRVIRCFLRYRPSPAGSPPPPARAMLPEEVVSYVERWNAIALGGYARYLRAEALAGEAGLPDAAVLPLTGARAGRFARAFVEPDMSAVAVAGLRGEAALRAAVADAVATAARATPAEPGEAPEAGAGGETGLGRASGSGSVAERPAVPPPVTDPPSRAPSGGWRAPPDDPADDDDLADDWLDVISPKATAHDGAPDPDVPVRRGASAARLGGNAARPVSGVDRTSILGALRSAAVAPIARAPCSAIVGLGDEFATEEDLLLAARPGLRPEVACLSVVDLDGPGVVSAAPESTPFALAKGFAADMRHIALVLANAEQAAVAEFTKLTEEAKAEEGRRDAVLDLRRLAFVVRRAAQEVESDFQENGHKSAMWAQKAPEGAKPEAE